MAKYRRLSAEEQVKMETLAEEGHSGKSIARILGRSQSTISRELGRNREGDQPYGATRAEALATGRRRAAAQAGGGGLGVLRGAPEGGLPPGADRGPGVSATWIYKWLREGRASGGELYLHLRRQGKRRMAKAAAGEAGAGLIPGRTDIGKGITGRC